MMKQRIPVFAYTIATCRLQDIGVEAYTTRVKNQGLESDYGSQA